MSSRFQTGKTELIAIYRLEFYKNKKNWKFCKDICDVPEKESNNEPQKDTEALLNQTYNIEAEPEIEDANNLNEAFLDVNQAELSPKIPPEPDIPKDQMDYSKTLIQDANRRVVCDAAGILSVQYNDPVQHCNSLEMCSDGGQHLYRGESQEMIYPGTPDCNFRGVPEWHDPGLEPGAADDVCQDVLDGEWNPECLLTAADQWLRSTTPDIKEVGSLSSESVVSFMRGAAAAPHSSEADLVSNNGVGEPMAVGEGVAGLSTVQLEASVSRHAKVLRYLLQEARARDEMGRNSHSLDHNWDDRPTRDPGLSLSQTRPLTPLRREETYIKDSFIAGSFRNFAGEEMAGRGRGRLRTRPGVIGIGMGRPYRL